MMKSQSRREAVITQVRLMRDEATRRLLDSEDLCSRAHRQSDSGYLLELLAFEILLKALLLIHSHQPDISHKYADLFRELPPIVRSQITRTARLARSTGDYEDVEGVLARLSRNFVELRYPYERYRGLSEVEYLARGDEWINGGALVEEADYVYYSVELNGLTQALLQEIDRWLGERRPHEGMPNKGFERDIRGM